MSDVCDGCGAVIGDEGIHDGVCPGRIAARRAVLNAWLDDKCECGGRRLPPGGGAVFAIVCLTCHGVNRDALLSMAWADLDPKVAALLGKATS